jgi:hypothetical protein
VRATVTGPVQTGFIPSSNGNATFVGYIDNPVVFFDQGNAFGNLGRNALTGPGFSNLDFALAKNTRIREKINWQVRADAFDALNHANFGNPGLTVGSSTFGLISATRFSPGDSGSSRQLQLSMKLTF